MSKPARPEILEHLKELLGAEYIVRWADGRTIRPDFEGANWTVDVFDVPAGRSFELGRRLGAYRRALSRQHRIGLVVITHTPEATDSHYPWVRREPEQRVQEIASEYHGRDTTAPPFQARSFEHGIQQ